MITTTCALSPAARLANRRGSDYAELLRQVREAGLLTPRIPYYVAKITSTTVAIVTGWVIFVMVGNSWWQLVTAAYLAIVFVQIAIIGHDAGHRQICRSRQANTAIGIIHMNIAIGLSFGLWVERHRRHHSNPNQEGRDPDISHKLIAFTAAQKRKRHGWRYFICRHQAMLVIPMIFLIHGIALHCSTVHQLVRSKLRHRSRELLLLVLHFCCYLSMVFIVLSPLRGLIFVLVQQGIFGGYLGLIIAPNHKGMAILDRSDKTSFLSRQLCTSRNITGGRLVEAVFGSLNYQIEHHLFPSMPRPCLRQAKSIVETFCRQRGLMYEETSIFDSYRQALHYLKSVGRAT
jgi:fatty acid desaturase